MFNNLAFMSVSVLARLTSGFFLFALLARIWGVETFGSFMLPYVVTSLSVIVIDYGFGLQLVRELSLGRSDSRSVVLRALAAKIILTGLVLAGSMLALMLIRPTLEFQALYWTLMVATVLNSFAVFFSLPLRALNRFKVESRTAVIANLALIAIVGVLAFLRVGPLGVALGFMIARLFYAGITFRALRQAIGVLPWRSLKAGEALSVLRAGFPFGVHLALGTLYFQADTLIIQQYLGSHEVGIYQAGMRLLLGGLILTEVLNNVYLPVMAQRSSQPSDLAKATSKMLRHSLLFGVAGFVLMTASAPWLVELIYGRDFAALASLLPYFAVVLLLRYVGLAWGLLLTVADKQSIRMLVVSLAFLINVGLNITLIPRFGIIGSLYASIITHVVLTAIYLGFIVMQRDPVGLSWRTATIITAASCNGILVFMLNVKPGSTSSLLVSLLLLLAIALAGISGDERTSFAHRFSFLMKGVASKMKLFKIALTSLHLMVKYLFCLPLYWFSLACPRDRNLWVFGAWFGKRYSDNSRYLFEHVRKNHPEIQAIWLTRDPGIANTLAMNGCEAYLANSVKGFFLSCRAAAIFVTCDSRDVNAIGLSRSKRIQLWHGTPLKKILADDRIGHQRKRSALYYLVRRTVDFLFPFTKERWDIITASSEVAKERLRSAFDVKEEVVAVTGYARGDVILASPPQPLPWLEELTMQSRSECTILYAPTFRGSGSSFNLFESLDLLALESFLEAHNATLLIKMHYHDLSMAGFLSGTAASRVKWLSETEAPDINVLLPHVDILLTDYSSVFYDFLPLGRPVLFAPFDLEQYMTRDRELYEDYFEATPGPKCRDWSEVIATLDEFMSGSDKYRSIRAEKLGRFDAFCDANNCARIVSVTQRLLKLPGEKAGFPKALDKSPESAVASR